MKSPMHISDLLAHRDGERLDPELAAQIDADPQARAQLNVLRRIKHELNGLPTVEPGEAVWAEIDRSRRPGWTPRYPLATAAAVFLAAALTIVVWNPLREPARSEPPAAVVRADGGLQDLMSRSRLLEAQLPARGVLASRLSGTSSQQALLYRISDIDAQLAAMYEAPTRDAQRFERLWSQRVELLEALAAVQRGEAVLRPAVY